MLSALAILDDDSKTVVEEFIPENMPPPSNEDIISIAEDELKNP